MSWHTSYIAIPFSPRGPEDRPAEIIRQRQEMPFSSSPTKVSRVPRPAEEIHYADWSYNEEDPVEDEHTTDVQDLTLRLQRALFRQHPDEIRQCLICIQELNESIESHLDRAFTLLREDTKLVDLYRKYRSCINLLEYAPIDEIDRISLELDRDPAHLFLYVMQQKDIPSLHTAISLADRKRMRLEAILTEVEERAEGKSFFITNTLSMMRGLVSLPHGMNIFELFRIAAVAENEFQKIDRGMRYLVQKETRCELPLFLDLRKRTCTLLTHDCKKGLVKKAPRAIIVQDREGASCDFVALTNRKGFRIEQKEIERLIHFVSKRKARGVTAGEVHSIFMSKTKQIVIQQRADGRLIDLPKELSLMKLLELFEQIALDVRDMHEDGVCHGDLSLKNALYKLQPDDSYLVWVSDLGLAFNPKEGEVPKTLVKKSYGTALCTAPETIEKPGNLHHPKAKDMYAIGVMLHQMLRGEPSWKEAIERYIETIDTDQNEILKYQILQKQRAIATELTAMRKRQEAGEAFTCADALTFVMLSLLDPNHKTRMTISLCANYLSQIRQEALRLS